MSSGLYPRWYNSYPSVKGSPFYPRRRRVLFGCFGNALLFGLPGAGPRRRGCCFVLIRVVVIVRLREEDRRSRHGTSHPHSSPCERRGPMGHGWETVVSIPSSVPQGSSASRLGFPPASGCFVRRLHPSYPPLDLLDSSQFWLAVQRSSRRSHDGLLSALVGQFYPFRVFGLEFLRFSVPPLYPTGV